MFDSSLASLIGVPAASLIAAGIGAYIGTYLNQRAKNAADNANWQEVFRQTQAITAATENIKAAISDDIWDRQEHWKLKRDVVFDAIHALADLDGAINKLGNALSLSAVNPSEEMKTWIKEQKYEAGKLHMQCSTAFQRAHSVADLAIHGGLSRAMSAYFQCAGKLLIEIQKGIAHYDPKSRLELATLHNAVIIAARRELGVRETDDLPVLDYENMTSGDGTDH